jgi:hypothetical protein
MTVALLTLLAIGQCGPGGCATGGGRVPQMPYFMPMMPPPAFVQPPAPPPFVSPTPPITSGYADGKLHRVEIEHSDGSRWWYTFSPAQEVSVKLDASNSNAAVSLDFNKGRKQTPPKSVKTCKNADCMCEDCKCDPCHCGKASPIEQVLEDTLMPNYGLDVSKIRSNSKEFDYSINGKRCTKRQAMDALAGDGIVDDSTHLRLSCIGTKEECQPIIDDVANNPAYKGQNFTFQAYRPDDPMVKEIGLVPGKPAVYLQQPDGKVLARWESYAGPEQTAGAIRKADPNYDPSKDPRPDKPSPLPDMAIDLKALMSKLPGWVWGVVAFFVFNLLNKSPVKV